MQSLLALLSKLNGKSITGLLVAALVIVFGYFGVNIKDLAPEISTAIANLINASVGIFSIGLAVWGHVQDAKKHGELVAHVQNGVVAGTVSPTSSAAKAVLPLLLGLLLIGATLGLTGCAGGLSSDVRIALNDISAATAKLQASGQVPQGRTSDVVSDANTISNALETINTGNGITVDQANKIAKSFKSNSSTTAYIDLAAEISQIVVPFVNGLIQAGESKSDVQAQTTQLLTQLPTQVQSAVDPNSNL